MQDSHGQSLVVLLATPEMEPGSCVNYGLLCTAMQRLLEQEARSRGRRVLFIYTTGCADGVSQYMSGKAHIAFFAGFSRWSDDHLDTLLEASTRVQTRMAFSTGGVLSPDRAAYVRAIGVPVMRGHREFRSIMAQLVESVAVDLCA